MVLEAVEAVPGGVVRRGLRRLLGLGSCCMLVWDRVGCCLGDGAGLAMRFPVKGRFFRVESFG